jgi:hypothetical protein
MLSDGHFFQIRSFPSPTLPNRRPRHGLFGDAHITSQFKLSYTPRLSYQSKQFLAVLGVLYSISAILVFAFFVVAVCLCLFCFVLLDSIIPDVSNGIMISSCRILRVMVGIESVSSSSIEVLLTSGLKIIHSRGHKFHVIKLSRCKRRTNEQ